MMEYHVEFGDEFESHPRNCSVEEIIHEAFTWILSKNKDDSTFTHIKCYRRSKKGETIDNIDEEKAVVFLKEDESIRLYGVHSDECVREDYIDITTKELREKQYKENEEYMKELSEILEERLSN